MKIGIAAVLVGYGVIVCAALYGVYTLGVATGTQW